MKYDYLLFDLDGTLVDTLRGVVISAQYALAKYGMPGFASFLTEFSISGGIFYFEYLCRLSSIKKENRTSHRFWKLEHSVCIETVALPPVIPMCSALHRRSVL